MALQPGALADPAIAEVLHRLVSDNVKYKLAPAATAEDLLSTSVVLGLMGAMLPEPIRGAYLVSLRKGLKEKLQSGFAFVCFPLGGTWPCSVCQRGKSDRPGW